MDLKIRSLNSEQGQTVVEYILLLVVAISLVMTFYNSSAYRRLFGEQGLIGVKIKSQSEFSYRHAFTVSGPSRERPEDVDRRNRDGSIHPSYADTANGETRFFGPQGAYGN